MPKPGKVRVVISIHALLAESDFRQGRNSQNINRDFYPRSPCGERPFSGFFIGCVDNFYPRSPCGERPKREEREPIGTLHFYPRSPCGERHKTFFFIRVRVRFLSTLSLRRATYEDVNAKGDEQISIHALLAESDHADRQQ